MTPGAKTGINPWHRLFWHPGAGRPSLVCPPRFGLGSRADMCQHDANPPDRLWFSIAQSSRGDGGPVRHIPPAAGYTPRERVPGPVPGLSPVIFMGARYLLITAPSPLNLAGEIRLA